MLSDHEPARGPCAREQIDFYNNASCHVMIWSRREGLVLASGSRVAR